MNNKTTPAKQENPLLNLGLNILLPVMLLKKGPLWFDLEPTANLLLALAFPVIYFIYDFARRKKANFISILGFVSILLTGGIGVLELPRTWFIAKEGGIPLIIGIALVISLKTKYPLVKTFLYNDNVLDVINIDALLKERGKLTEFKALMDSSTWIIAASFFFSSAVQFVLASVIVTVEPAVDPVLFNEQVGDMTWITYLVILIPSFLITGYALLRLVKKLEKLTGLKSFEELLSPQLREKAEASK